MTSFDHQICQRLPLADSVYQLLHFVAGDSFLEEIFDQYRGASYEKTISFPTFVHLIADTLLQRQKSAHKHFQSANDDGTLPASVTAMYGKLKRIPIALSQGLLLKTTHRLREVFPKVTDPLPQSLDHLEVLAFDGKKIKYVAKRMKILRNLRGHIYGGRMVVVQQVTTGLALAIGADADGEIAENHLVRGAVEQVREQPGDKPRLWIGDRLFCDLKQIPLLKADGDHYLLRYNRKNGFHRDKATPGRTGVDAHGVPYSEEWGYLGAASNPDRQYVRRITLHRPAGEAIVLVTDLLDGAAYPAADLLEAYLRRWGIETLFQRVTQIFDLRHLISSTPEATVFQASFCFLLANVIAAVRGYIAAAEARGVESISTENLFADVIEELIAWNKLLSERQTVELFEEAKTAEEVRKYVAERVTGIWRKAWQKSKTKPKKPKGKTSYLKGGHSSVDRIVRGVHELTSDPSQINNK